MNDSWAQTHWYKQFIFKCLEILNYISITLIPQSTWFRLCPSDKFSHFYSIKQSSGPEIFSNIMSFMFIRKVKLFLFIQRSYFINSCHLSRIYLDTASGTAFLSLTSYVNMSCYCLLSLDERMKRRGFSLIWVYWHWFKGI